VSVKIPPNILKNVLDNSYKRKADGSIDCRYDKAHVSTYNIKCSLIRLKSGEYGGRNSNTTPASRHIYTIFSKRC
jgi:hypothetical protein